MQLYYASASPFARKCIVTLHETGQLDDVELVTATGTPLDASQMPVAHNPLGKLPALSRPDGPAIYDSRVICRYLDARADGGLYPERSLWETLTLEATADGIMDAAVLMVYEGRCRPENLQSADWVEAQWEKISRALDAVNTRWMSHLAGPLDMSHIAIGCALGYLDFRHDQRNWRKGRDALDDWFAVFAERPGMRASRPDAV
ncbi:MAG TPA: glutathione S-transferase [Rhodobacteraceae bacterium]|nr:glutathione S-transferase [Paracoccaceae bacterium]